MSPVVFDVQHLGLRQSTLLNILGGLDVARAIRRVRVVRRDRAVTPLDPEAGRGMPETIPSGCEEDRP
jgi:hypothetical protein